MLTTGFKNFFFSLLLVSICQGAPATNKKKKFGRGFDGRATWFTPNTGACGDTNSESDSIVAMNVAQYGGSCHKTVRITNKSNGKTATAKVTDKCPGCDYGSLDLTPSVFKQLGDLNAGVLPMHAQAFRNDHVLDVATQWFTCSWHTFSPFQNIPTQSVTSTDPACCQTSGFPEYNLSA